MANLINEVRRSARLAVQVPTLEAVTTAISTTMSPDPKRPKKKPKLQVQCNSEEPHPSSSGSQVYAKSSKRTKRSLNPEDYPARVANSWKIGAHVSAAGGVENSVLNAASVGANAFALFLKSQRKWESASLTDDSISAFKSRLQSFGYLPSHVLPHGSYLINLGNPDKDKREKSYECFLDDLRRCEQLGIPLYNFHPGSTVGAAPLETSISLIAECLNRAHKATKFVVTVVENMAGSGNVIGSSFEDLASIIRKVEDKTRVGVCLDTCHLFAAGYDIRSQEGWNATMEDFESRVGLSFLKGMHINDSKTELASKKDRHENIGLGHLGLSTFRLILTDPRTQNIPLILETPSFEADEVWGKEIDVLNRLSHAEGDDGLDYSDIKKVVACHSSKDSKKTSRSIKARQRKKRTREDDEDQSSE